MGERYGRLDRVHGGNIYRAALNFGGKPAEYLDFSSNVNPLGSSPRALEAAAAVLADSWRYPDPDCRELKEALAGYFGVPAPWVLPGNGTSELINLLVPALGIRRAVIPVPTFSEYAHGVGTWGGKVDPVRLSPEDGFQIDVGHLIKALPGADALFLCQPNNPTGRVLLYEDLLVLAKKAERAGTFLIIDEAFLDFVPGNEGLTAAGLLPRHGQVVILRSLTKFFGLAGLRLGALLAVPRILDKVKAVTPPWNVNVMAQAAGVAAVRDEEYIRKTLRVVAAEREFLVRALGGLPGLRVFEGAANFLLLHVSGTGPRAAEITRRLAEKRVLVRNCDNFAGLDDGFIRVAVRLRPQNERLAEALRSVLRTE